MIICVICLNTLNFCSRLLKMLSKRRRFQNFSRNSFAPSVLASHAFAVTFFLLHLLQSFCHLLQILLKTLVVQSWVKILNPGLVRNLNSGRGESLKSKFNINLFVYSLMIGCSKKNGECYPRNAFEQPWVSANRPSNNWTLVLI